MPELKQDGFIKRKTFLRLVSMAFAAAFIGLWNLMGRRQAELSSKPVLRRINLNKLGTGVYIYETFIIVKSGNGFKIFSNKCTHAGCRINHESNGQLVCPCHGSRYDAKTGKVLQGPAGLSLPIIPFSTDSKTGERIIKA